jgi:hypothetical protein
VGTSFTRSLGGPSGINKRGRYLTIITGNIRIRCIAMLLRNSVRKDMNSNLLEMVVPIQTPGRVAVKPPLRVMGSIAALIFLLQASSDK